MTQMIMKTQRLDTFYKIHNLNPTIANFANFDIQGNELNAMKGMGDLLPHFDYIYTEVNTKHLYKGCCLLSDIDAYLTPFGFQRVETKMTRRGWGDALYIKNQTPQ